jgi:3-hydroxybutyryl-CoA dehydratase
MISSFELGQSYKISAAISVADIEQFVRLSGDAAPLHTNAEFARKAGFTGPVVHGAFLIALVSRLVGMHFPGPNAVLERIDVSFRKPCYAPCDVELNASVRQISEAVATIVLDITISDTSGVIASGKSWHRILELESVS